MYIFVHVIDMNRYEYTHVFANLGNSAMIARPPRVWKMAEPDLHNVCDILLITYSHSIKYSIIAIYCRY